MVDPPKAEQDLNALKLTVATITALLKQLQSSVALATSETNEKHSNVNALDLAHDSASLIKAHSTKLSLLIINRPFTATAINTVLRELIAGPLPGLASAVEICNATIYTKAMALEMQYRAKRVLVELGTFVASIPLDGNILSDDQKNGTGVVKGKGSLANTGVVWQACEAVIELKKLGVAALVIKKADEYRALLKDALEELQEWGDESDDEEGDEDEAEGSGDEGEEDAAQKAVDDLFASQQHIPKADPDKLRPRLESTQKRLRLVITMYQAVAKRRFKTLPKLPISEVPAEPNEKPSESQNTLSSLDKVLDIMKAIPDITDELANAFYELDEKEIDKRMDECFTKGSDAVEILLKNWEGKEDEFTTWVCWHAS